MTSPGGLQNRWGIQEDVQQLVRFISGACDLVNDDLLALDEQLRRAAVVKNTPTMIDVKVPKDAPRLAVGEGPLPVRAVILGELGEEIGEVLVWIRDGELQGVEQAWYIDPTPTQWPSPNELWLQ